MEAPAGDDDRWVHHTNAGEGYEALGMAEEALEEFGRVPVDSATGEKAQLRSMRIEVALGRYAEAIARGRALERVGCLRPEVLDLIGLAHELAGRHLEALVAWRPLWPHFWNDGGGSYGIACSLSKLGQFGQAARWLVRSFELSADYHAQAFLHAEIEPLLRHGARGELGLSALAFGHPAVARAMATASAHRGEIRLDALQLDVLPDLLRPWFGAVDLAKSAIRMRPGAPREIRRAYLAWQAERVAANVALGAKAAERAARWILDRQLEWAAAHSRAGNCAGARYHALFLIAHRPEAYDRVEKEMRSLGLGYLFDDLGSVPRDVAVQLAGVWAAWASGSSGPREGFETVGGIARRCGLGLIMEGAALNAEGHLEDAEAAYEASSKHWPGDPAPVANRIMALIAMGRWDDAESVYFLGPEWGGAFAAWWVFGERILDRDAGNGKVPWGEFYGQPDLGGILAPGWEIPVSDSNNRREDG